MTSLLSALIDVAYIPVFYAAQQMYQITASPASHHHGSLTTRFSAIWIGQHK